jgi:AbrB family looped-hinge helix DNA binding protein
MKFNPSMMSARRRNPGHAARIGERGQIVIAKPIRDALGIRPKQVILQRVEGRCVVLAPVPDPRDLAGAFPGLLRGARSVAAAKRTMDKGWD